jgi:nucleoside-diphosphate-sugar epimerase
MFFYKLLNGMLEYVTNHERDFIHIDDVCDAFELLLDHGFTGSLDVGTGISIKIDAVDTTLPVNTHKPNERQKTKANTRKMSFFGFKPKIDVRDFIANNIRR